MPADKHEEGKPSGFKVSDRRSFSETGDTRDAPPPSEPAPKVTVSPPRAPVAAESEPKAPTEPDPGPPVSGNELPPVDFHTFILSLGSSALLHLGELDQPDGSESRPDLRLAKHTIDIIAMLQAKTKGNLSSPEERLIESLLYDLRLRYVERSKGGGAVG